MCSKSRRQSFFRRFPLSALRHSPERISLVRNRNRTGKECCFFSTNNNTTSSNHSHIAKTSKSTNTRTNRSNNYDEPFRSDENVFIWQADPSAPKPESTVGRNQLVWGSVLWPSGVCLSKYLWWLYASRSSSANLDETSFLELGCGTGLVGLTAAKLGAQKVILTDSATSDLRPLIEKSAASNGISLDSQSPLDIRTLDWKDVDTFVDWKAGDVYDVIVAADVLYGGGDALFARVLASHMPSIEEASWPIKPGPLATPHGPNPTTALVACPNRKDSPLFKFFKVCQGFGLSIERLETPNGAAAGASHGVRDLDEAFAEASFVPMEEILEEPVFAPTNRDEIQLFRLQRIRGTAEEARSVRRVSRL